MAMNCGGIFDYAAKAEKLEELNQALEDPKVWEDPQRAQAMGKEKKSLEDVVLVLHQLAQQLNDTGELFELLRQLVQDQHHILERFLLLA
ncbi:MAG: PCRF domain-containing protein, partial [Sterolibacterium sp.]|nr:PCRF domain-containing protein [Sterolibacterium sp.]